MKNNGDILMKTLQDGYIKYNGKQQNDTTVSTEN